MHSDPPKNRMININDKISVFFHIILPLLNPTYFELTIALTFDHLEKYFFSFTFLNVRMRI